MKKIWLIILLLLPAMVYSQQKSILFLGNSYIFTNNIPGIVKKLSKSAGQKTHIASYTKGGIILQQLLNSPRTRTKIKSRKWGYIILQEQSYTAVAKTKDIMYPAVRALDSLIKNQGSRTVLYMLMPKEYSKEAVFTMAGDSVIHYYNVFKSFSHAQDSLQKIHLTIGKEIDAVMAPVGLAWENALKEKPELKLWKGDRVHPTKMGAYLTACVFYAVLFNKTPVGLSYHANLTAPLAGFFQKVAAQTVLDNKHLWNIP